MASLLSSVITCKRSCVSILSIFIASFILSGCGEKGKDTQVAAKVNSDEITIRQVNNALATIPVAPGKNIEDVKREVLDNLIVQKLAGQRAIQMKLDRSPATMQELENAKNTILARAYMDPVVAEVAKPSNEDVHKFYVDHPELFSDRNVYNLRELEVETKPDLAQSIRDQVGKGEKIDFLAGWLKAQKMTPAIHTGIKPAEQIPSEILSTLSKLSDGRLMVVEQNKSISVLQVISKKREPVEEAPASPIIKGYLSNTKTKEAVDKEIKALKAAAKIEYVGAFADIGKKDKSPIASSESNQTTGQDHGAEIAKSEKDKLQKGLSGLK